MADDDLDLSNPTPLDPYNQGPVRDFLYNKLVPEYLKSEFYEPHKNPNYNPKDPNSKLGYTPGATDFTAQALPDVLSWLAPAAKSAGLASKAIMAGPMARTANLRNLKLAKEMWSEGSKYTPEQIHDATGWFKSGGGSPRFEISDAGMKANRITPSGGMFHGPVHAYIDHPELFEAYPQLRNTPVVVDPFYSHSGEGKYSYIPPPFKITVGGEANRSGLDNDQLKTLIHELQHNVSYQEGTEMGASPGWIGDTVKWKGDNLLRQNIDDPRKIKDVFLSRKYAQNPNVSFEMYKRLPGETEARNAAYRWQLSDRGLLSNPGLRYPWSTEDYPREKQFDYSSGLLAQPYGGK